MHTLEIGQANFAELAAAILGEGSTLRFRARGLSMWPFIRDGDILEVRPIGAAAVRRGDVILGQQGSGRLIAHRVVRINRGNSGVTKIVTQGDALSYPDEPISLEQILGRAVVVEQRGKRIRLDAGRQGLAVALWLGLAPFRKWLYCAWTAFGRRINHKLAR